MTDAGPCVRVAGAADLARVVEIERGAPEAPHWADVDYAAVVNTEVDAASSMRRCLLVAEAEGRLLGFAVGKVVSPGAGGVGELESVVVEGAARRRGVARALCLAVIAWSREQGAMAMELEVRAGSEGAIALYGGLGFVFTGQRRGYYRGPVEDAVLMRLILEKSD